MDAFARWIGDPNVLTAASTAVIALFTVILSFVGYTQARLIRKSTELAERAVISTERAFVFLEDFDPDFAVMPRGGGGKKEVSFFKIKPRWRNSGKTPTRNMRIRINWTHWSGDNLTGVGEYGDIQPTKMFLGPNAAEWSEALSIPGHVATMALNHGEKINIWGRVDYEDIFDRSQPHFTEWCYQLHLTESGVGLRTQFVAFSEYNRSDEDNRSKRGA